MAEQPLACALPADEAERQARQTRTTLGAAVLSREEIEGGLRLQLPGDDATAAAVGGVAVLPVPHDGRGAARRRA